MRWFTIKRDSDNQKLNQATVASIRTKLKDYQPSQGRSEFGAVAINVRDTLHFTADVGSVDYVKVDIDEDNPLSERVPFSIH